MRPIRKAAPTRGVAYLKWPATMLQSHSVNILFFGLLGFAEFGFGEFHT